MKAKAVTGVILALTLVLAPAVFVGAISNSDLSRLSTQKIGQNQFKFYVAKGKFGDIWKNKDIIVPEGTVLEAVRDGLIYRYTTIDEIVLPARSSEKLVSAILTQGENVALPRGAVNKHYFTRYFHGPKSSPLLITNINQ